MALVSVGHDTPPVSRLCGISQPFSVGTEHRSLDTIEFGTFFSVNDNTMFCTGLGDIGKAPAVRTETTVSPAGSLIVGLIFSAVDNHKPLAPRFDRVGNAGRRSAEEGLAFKFFNIADNGEYLLRVCSFPSFFLSVTD